MSRMFSLEDKLSTINKNERPNIIPNEYIIDPNYEEEEEKIVQYRNLPHDLNSISLKTRFTCKKMLDLMENNKEEDLTLEDLNDPKKAEINKQKLNRKIIQYYCMENAEKNKFAPPSEKTMNKLQQFKKWQKYEIFQKDGIKNYLNNVLPDYKLIYNTSNLIHNKMNLYTKLRIKRNYDSIILPNIDSYNNYINNIKYNYSNNYQMKESDLFNDQSQSYMSLNDREKNLYKRSLNRNKSLEDFNFNSSISSKLINPNSIRSPIKNRQINSLRSKNQSMSLINLMDNNNINKQIKTNKNKSIMKSFEDSTFCYSKVKVPLTKNKSITSSPYGGGIFHSSSLLRNKSMNDLLANPSQKKILQKLNDYNRNRSRIINNKDFLQHIGKTFVTMNKHLNDYDYNVFQIFYYYYYFNINIILNV